MSNRNYPHVSGFRRYKGDIRNHRSNKCPCGKQATGTATIQVSWFRGDDESEPRCEEHREVGHLPSPLETERDELRAKLADWLEVDADHKRLVRELDVALSGEDGAAKQASLCDLIDPVRKLREKLEAHQSTVKPLAEAAELLANAANALEQSEEFVLSVHPDEYLIHEGTAPISFRDCLNAREALATYNATK